MKRLKIIFVLILAIFLVVKSNNNTFAYPNSPGDYKIWKEGGYTKWGDEWIFAASAQSAQNSNNIYCLENGDALKDAAYYHYTCGIIMQGETVKIFRVENGKDACDLDERPRTEEDNLLAAILYETGDYGELDLGMWMDQSKAYTDSQLALYEHWNRWRDQEKNFVWIRYTPYGFWKDNYFPVRC